MVCVGWAKIEQYAEEVVKQIQLEFSPDWIVGIGRGGLLPAVLVCEGLGVQRMTTLFVNSYNKRKQQDVTITHWPDVDLSGCRVLIVDDIAASGNTFTTVVDAIQKRYHPQCIRTAALVINADRCLCKPDFYARAIHRAPNDWIVFPWDKQEYPEFFGSEVAD